MTFVDNVATLGIENCLLDPLHRIFTSQVINDMEDNQVQELAAELPYISEERDGLAAELKKLQAGLRTLSIFNIQKPLLDSPPIFGMSHILLLNNSTLTATHFQLKSVRQHHQMIQAFSRNRAVHS